MKVTYENSNELFFNFSPLNGGRYCEGESMKFRTCNVKVKNWLGYVSASLPTDWNIISLSEMIKEDEIVQYPRVVKTAKKKNWPCLKVSSARLPFDI